MIIGYGENRRVSEIRHADEYENMRSEAGVGLMFDGIEM